MLSSLSIHRFVLFGWEWVFPFILIANAVKACTVKAEVTFILYSFLIACFVFFFYFLHTVSTLFCTQGMGVFFHSNGHCFEGFHPQGRRDGSGELKLCTHLTLYTDTLCCATLTVGNGCVLSFGRPLF
jgi:hypothetical protein